MEEEGRGAVYGSDAIAGVVNFITHNDIDGAEAFADYGRTAQGDGKRHSLNILWGTRNDKFDALLGGGIQSQDEVSAGNRDFSKFALYLYNGIVTHGGSSRTPNGRIALPPGSALATQFGCDSVTRKEGASGAALSDYRCFDSTTDLFNYQPYNLLVTPQKRGNVFADLDYRINEHLATYGEVLYNHTSSGFQIAPLTFNAVGDGVLISKDSLYNPFGIDFGGSGANPDAQYRLLAVGTRRSDTTTDSKIINVGAKGQVAQSSWQWDFNLGYARLDQIAHYAGYLFQPALKDAFGPSFIATDGTPTCGTPTAPIANCTPVDVFDLTAPGQVDALATISAGYSTDQVYQTNTAGLNADGNLWALPAGDLKVAVGAEYRKLEQTLSADHNVQAQPPLFLNCVLAAETCTGDAHDSYDSKEFYAEFFIPLLKDMPGVHALNLTAGSRYSDYSRFGNTTRSQFKIEYRPVRDLLLRGSLAQVFRAPTIADISAAPLAASPVFTDPCTGLTAADVAANPNLAPACEGVARDGSFSEPNGQITGLITSNPDLQPETGRVTTFGAVYDSSQVENLSVEADFWRYRISNLITPLDPNFAIGQCVATGAPQFCSLGKRFDATSPNAGQFMEFLQPTVNLGELKTEGVDIGLRYALRSTPIGALRFSLDATHIDTYENVPAPGAAPIEVVGTYNRQFGNYARWRGLLGVGWSLQNFEGLLSARYIHRIELLGPDGGANSGGGPPLQIPSFTYLDLTLAYQLPSDTKIRIGVQNLTDKGPPILFQNNTLNSNTDVQTYDLIGRRFYINVTQRF